LLERKQDKPITGGWPGKPTLESATKIQKKKKKFHSFSKMLFLSFSYLSVSVRLQKLRITKLA